MSNAACGPALDHRVAVHEAVLVSRRWHVDRLATVLADVRCMDGDEFRHAYRRIGVYGFIGPESEERA